tara:strand:- start:203 stop:1042 length:840 start_codon:yes stop_codon:yes gene_type:complete
MFGTRKWLDIRAKETGINWCEWPKEFSKSGVCRTCVSYYSKQKVYASDTMKQLNHLEKQRKLIVYIRKKQNGSINGVRFLDVLGKWRYTYNESVSDIRREQFLKKIKDTPKPVPTPNPVPPPKPYMNTPFFEEKPKLTGEYCTYHHSSYGPRCHCERDREGLIKWYSRYDRNKQCVRCDSLSCDCPRTKEGNILKKIIVKEVYEYIEGKCEIHAKKNCECADSIKCLVTETLRGTSYQKLCTLHSNTGCECGEDPTLYKIIKEVPEGGWNYDWKKAFPN